MKKVTIYDEDKKDLHALHVIVKDGKYYIGWWMDKNEFYVMHEVDKTIVDGT